MAMQVTNPATGEVLETFEEHDEAAVEERLARAAAAFVSLRRTTFAQRAAWMQGMAKALEDQADEAARDVVLEMGKPITAAKAEIAKCVKAFRYYAQHAESQLADVPADAAAVNASRALTRYQPIGVVLAVMPWNFPYWQAVRFMAPALMAGNVGLLKHASNVPRTALRLQRIAEEGGFPEGAFQTLLIGSRQVERVLRDPRVVAATLTGSEPAGQSVAAIAGDEIKPTVLELGGSDPYVVLPSADIARAAQVAVTARCQNNGQSCIAAKRFIVHTEVYDDFVQRFVEGLRDLRMGDPLEEETQLGPLYSASGRDELHEMVQDARDKGATILCGGEVPESQGAYYPATAVADVTREMRLWAEEAFGPVATVIRAESVEEALALANESSFGLGSNVWAEDPGLQEQFIDGLEAGMVFVNGMVTSYPELPFGGVKRSGYGRELADLGIKAFCNAKTVWVGKSGSDEPSAKTE